MTTLEISRERAKYNKMFIKLTKDISSNLANDGGSLSLRMQANSDRRRALTAEWELRSMYTSDYLFEERSDSAIARGR